MRWLCSDLDFWSVNNPRASASRWWRYSRSRLPRRCWRSAWRSARLPPTTVAITGLLVASALRLPLLVVGTLAVVVGAAMGLDSPPEVISLAEAVAMLIGTGLGALIALVVVIAGASLIRRDWQRIGVRVLGSWTAASALLAIAVRFAR